MEYTIQNEYLKVTAADLGAELRSVTGADGTEYLWQGESGYWSDRAPILFPYVGRMTDECYEMDGNTYRMGVHGFAAVSRFDLAFCGDERMVWELVSNEQTRAAYPREFSFRVIYALAGKTLEITFEVENRDKKDMRFGLGGHPGFRVPLKDGLSFEDYRLTFSRKCMPLQFGLSPACFLDGTETPFLLEKGCTLPLRHDLFDHDAIVMKGMAGEIRLETEKDAHSVTVRFPRMDYLGLWQQAGCDAPYICIEPWCSLPSVQDRKTVFEGQSDLIRLAPGSIYRNNWEIIVGP